MESYRKAKVTQLQHRHQLVRVATRATGNIPNKDYIAKTVIHLGLQL